MERFEYEPVSPDIFQQQMMGSFCSLINGQLLLAQSIKASVAEVIKSMGEIHKEILTEINSLKEIVKQMDTNLRQNNPNNKPVLTPKTTPAVTKTFAKVPAVVQEVFERLESITSNFTKITEGLKPTVNEEKQTVNEEKQTVNEEKQTVNEEKQTLKDLERSTVTPEQNSFVLIPAETNENEIIIKTEMIINESNRRDEEHDAESDKLSRKRKECDKEAGLMEELENTPKRPNKRRSRPVEASNITTRSKRMTTV